MLQANGFPHSTTGRKAVFNHAIFHTGVLLVFTCLFCSCARREISKVSAPQTATAAQNEVKVVPDQQSSPTLAEVKEAVARVFKDSATIDSRQTPNFLVGDFNGDSSQDLAVILKPATGKLDDMNQEFPPWILRDVFVHPKVGAPPMRMNANEQLMAVIHGYGKNGWRDPQATQTYLLKNAVGPAVKAYTKSEVESAAQGKKVPHLVGDLIGESLRGQSGYLYFNGAQYAWYDPQTFTGEVATRLVHPGTMPNKKIDLLHPKLLAAEK